MKKRFCKICALLAAALLALMPALAFSEDDTTLFIPYRLTKLGLPDVPQVPELTVRMDTVDGGDPCPVAPDPDGKLYIRFSGPVDECILSRLFDGEMYDPEKEKHASKDEPYYSMYGAVIPIDGNGCGEADIRFLIDPEEEDLNDIWFQVTVGDLQIEYEFYWGRWVPWSISLHNHEDYFRSGQSGPDTSIEYTWVPVAESHEGADGVWYNDNWWWWGDRTGYFMDTWYVSSVSVEYKKGSYIRSAEAEYRNDEKKSLSIYRVEYAVNEDETYTVTYAPETTSVFQRGWWDFDAGAVGKNTPSQTVYNEDGYVIGYITHYTQDEPLQGEYYVRSTDFLAYTGSGDNKDKWYAWDTMKQVRKPGLRSVMTFVSPRVE